MNELTRNTNILKLPILIPPQFAVNDPLNISLVVIEPARQHINGGSGLIDPPHFTDDFPRQSCPAVTFSNVVYISTLIVPVTHIVLVGAKQKMGWIHALRIVTQMKRVLSVWNYSPAQNPCRTMRKNLDIRALLANAYLAIISPTKRPNPKPAFSKAGIFFREPAIKIHLFPEPLREAARKGLKRVNRVVKLSLHNQFVWLCRALDYANSAGAFSYRLPFSFCMSTKEAL